MVGAEVGAVAGVAFQDLHRVMTSPLKPVTGDPDLMRTTRRLLRELGKHGLVVRDGDRYRLGDSFDPELRAALEYIGTLDSPTGQRWAA
jgi:hypothetical protein